MSSLKCSTDCSLTKCSEVYSTILLLRVKRSTNIHKLTLADGILNLCTCPLVVVDNGIKLKDGITASPLVILYNITNLR